MGGRGDGAGGFMSIAPRAGTAEALGGAFGGGGGGSEGGGGDEGLPLPARDLEGGDGERDLERES